jgi:ribosome biogenesis protein Tsr3
VAAPGRAPRDGQNHGKDGGLLHDVVGVKGARVAFAHVPLEYLGVVVDGTTALHSTDRISPDQRVADRCGWSTATTSTVGLDRDQARRLLFALAANTTSIIAIHALTGIAVLALALLVVTVPETAQRPSEPLEGAPSGEPARHLL